jgi:3,4-dihydroxy-2-butanone 4-phosphate synthase
MIMQDFKLNSIEEAIAEIQAGKVVIVVDDEDRENEGDFLTAARNATPEVVNFMATHGRGLICAPLSQERCKELELDLMVQQNSATYETPFTISVDLNGHGCTTGISTSDRSKTILALINNETKPEDLGRPGHIFPLRAKGGGVLRRAGHTEAAVDLARLAGFEPAGIIVEILNEDGTMARLPELLVIAEKFEAMVKLGSINSRMKDFYDIWMLSRQFEFDGEHLAEAIRLTFDNRNTALPVEIEAFSDEFINSKQIQWTAFARRLNQEHVPAQFQDIIKGVRAFLYPLISALFNQIPVPKKWNDMYQWATTIT